MYKKTVEVTAESSASGIGAATITAENKTEKVRLFFIDPVAGAFIALSDLPWVNIAVELYGDPDAVKKIWDDNPEITEEEREDIFCRAGTQLKFSPAAKQQTTENGEPVPWYE